jgi:hypothetical protein
MAASVTFRVVRRDFMSARKGLLRRRGVPVEVVMGLASRARV